jgi:hypothetical protein
MERLSVTEYFCNASGMQGRKPVTFQVLVTDWSEDIITASHGCWGGDLFYSPISYCKCRADKFACAL